MTRDTYSAILQAARSLFIRKGYTAASMREIAEEAGIGKATIYHHFQDKEAIFKTLIEANVGRMNQSVESILKESEPRRRIEVAALVTLQFLYESADLLQIARREVPGARENLLQHFIVFFASYSAALEEAFQKGMDEGIFRSLDPKDTALVFMNLIQGNFALYYLVGKRPDTPEKAASRLLDIFFNGINASSKG
ncbi:MAG TPA: TetR/AcrR family transcriptional regulator [Anaerolineaceae bacterium]|nr:TetR/AcrR family transcriptional regulator [Anaerolineaceae bacterium]HPN53138.1 TetR/AcrR family transcriptional regulator [Anaerolineaceae bacterium]